MSSTGVRFFSTCCRYILTQCSCAYRVVHAQPLIRDSYFSSASVITHSSDQLTVISRPCNDLAYPYGQRQGDLYEMHVAEQMCRMEKQSTIGCNS